jgi:hypothetical protein
MKPIYIWGALVLFLIGYGIHFAWVTDTRYNPKPPVAPVESTQPKREIPCPVYGVDNRPDPYNDFGCKVNPSVLNGPLFTSSDIPKPKVHKKHARSNPQFVCRWDVEGGGSEYAPCPKDVK